MKKIVVVDNSKSTLNFMSDLLGDRYEVRTAVDGLSALTVIRDFRPDIIFIDLVMPNISGDKLCTLVRGMPGMEGVFIVILSAVAAEQKFDFARLGADACIAKGPLNLLSTHILDLLARISAGNNNDLPVEVIGKGDLFQREVTRELLSSKRHFEVTLENITEGFIELTIEGRIVFVNPATVDILGIPEERLLSSVFWEIFEGEQHRQICSLWKKVSDNPFKIEEEYEVAWKNRVITLSLFPVTHQEQKTIIVIVHDITERKKFEEELCRYQENLEELVRMRTAELLASNRQLSKEIEDRKTAEGALKESEDKFRELADMLPQAVFEIDLGLKIIYSNLRGYEIAGYSPEEFGHGMDIVDLLVPEDRTGMRDALSSIIQGNQNQVHASTLLRKNKSRCPVLIDFRAVAHNGAPAGARGIIVDISDMKQALDEKEKMKNQLRQAQKMEALGNLAGGIAHDFNNILTAILGYSEIASLQLPADSPVRGDLCQVIAAGKRAKDLVRHILTFSRRTEQDFGPLQIHLVVEEALKLIRASIPATIEIIQDIDQKCGVILGNITQVHQVIMNLCTNAAYAMTDGGKLRVRLEKTTITETPAAISNPSLSPGEYVRLTVIDTGNGMEQTTLERIFEPYFTTKGPGEGTGLGLAMVHGIVSDHCGMITVASTKGVGTTIEVYFPSAQGESPGTHDPVKDLQQGTESILFVDDEVAVARLIKEFLGYLGYTVDIRVSSLEALEAFRANPGKYDLVITDLTMPGLTGVELAKEMLRVRKDIPIILCSGYSRMITEEKAKQIGIRRFVMKPLVVQELAEIIRACLSGDGEIAGPVFLAGPGKATS